MNYNDTLAWMYDKLPMFHRIGAAAYKADLSNTIRLLNHLGNPQHRFKSIHIAGTNGKGSTSHMIASVLQEAGYKTGLFTSPHLTDYRERIRINGEIIDKEYVTDFITTQRQAFEEMGLSFFEMTTGLAFEYFASQLVDIAVIETGMGGRLDSTNLIRPLVSVITNVGYDHMQFLGDTLPLIAKEKAGIMKADVPVVIGEWHRETFRVFEQHAAEVGAPLTWAEKVFDAVRIETGNHQVQTFDLWKDSTPFVEQLEFPLLGHYQQKNLITACTALDLLGNHFDLEKKHFKDGLEAVVRNTGLRGRWQIISRNPLAIADTGHNADGIKEVVMQLRQMQFQQLHFVLGMVSDKSHDAILQLLPRHAEYYFCRPDIPRGLAAETLARQAEVYNLRGKVFDSVRDAYHAALNNARPGDMVFVGGSTFVVAEVV
ncbi:MAG: bifunctional folylpolyglutamate synthase/dihydrofolate synthase [Bacteroidetes bacterium]|nr:bifunctional folylpolyglutamate synthase/dihydrofolate synthase [Bacteroidota bacterium]